MLKTATRWLLAGLLCLALWPAVAHAQSPELMDAANQSLDFRVEGRYQDALPFAKEALRLSEREFGFDHPTTSILRNNLAELYAEAESFHERKLALFEQMVEKMVGSEHLLVALVAQSLDDLAELYRAQGRYAEAEPLH